MKDIYFKDIFDFLEKNQIKYSIDYNPSKEKIERIKKAIENSKNKMRE